MIRPVFRVAATLFAALATTAAILATPLPASAQTARHLCEAYDSISYCLGSANYNNGTYVEERIPGRDLLLEYLGYSYDNRQANVFAFEGNPSKCVGLDNTDSAVVVRPCTGGHGVVWAREYVTKGVYRWVNRNASETYGTLYYLVGEGYNDALYVVEPCCVKGWYYSFVGTS